MPLFSVIIPAHNRSKLLGRCLKSIDEQTFKDFEVVLVDDASTEDIKSVTASYADRLNLKFVRNQNSMGGPARPRNIAISIAEGQWLAFLDDDDWWYPEKLKRMLPFLECADVIYHQLDVCDVGGKVLCKTRLRQLKTPVVCDLLENGNTLPNSSVVARADTVKYVGGVDESVELIAVEDFDLWLRLATKTERFKFVDEKLGGYCVGKENISKRSEAQICGIKRVYEKHMKDIDSKTRKNALAAMSYFLGHYFFSMGECSKSRSYYFRAISSNKLGLKTKAIIRLCETFVKRGPAWF